MNRIPAWGFRDLIVRQKAHRFVIDVYKMTEAFPKNELFGLTSQLHRAAVSIPANIAEGFVKRGANDKARFMSIAQGSLEECRYYLILSQDLNYSDTRTLMPRLEEISKLLTAYASSILTPDF